MDAFDKDFWAELTELMAQASKMLCLFAMPSLTTAPESWLKTVRTRIQRTEEAMDRE